MLLIKISIITASNTDIPLTSSRANNLSAFSLIFFFDGNNANTAGAIKKPSTPPDVFNNKSSTSKMR
ncbi:hypothetical protein D3C78_1613040 [compost metagenome]